MVQEEAAGITVLRQGNGMNIYIDVDGTIQDLDDNLRPYTDLLMSLPGVILWSGGGKEYAQKLATANGWGCLCRVKMIPSDFSTADVLVDDDKDVVRMANDIGAVGIWVPAYNMGLMPNDCVLKGVYECIKNRLCGTAA